MALAAKFPVDYQFARIARSETMHQAALRTLLTRYGLTDPTAGLADGVFSTKEFQTLYNDLVGSATTAANALGVGVTIAKLGSGGSSRPSSSPSFAASPSTRRRPDVAMSSIDVTPVSTSFSAARSMFTVASTGVVTHATAALTCSPISTSPPIAAT